MVREGRQAEARDGLRTVFGEARAEAVAAAFMPNQAKETRMPERRKGHGAGDAPGRRPQQHQLF